MRLIQQLFVSAKDCEARFICRHLQGKMRMGFSEMNLQCSIGQAVVLTPLPYIGLCNPISSFVQSFEKIRNIKASNSAISHPFFVFC